MKQKQLDLFIQSNVLCHCNITKHVLTKAEYQYSIDKLKKIKDIILTTGWDLSDIYYYYKDTIDSDCNAWDKNNTNYLVMRSEFHEECEKAELNVKRN